MLEALLSGVAEVLLLIQDSVACKGCSLLKSFVTAAAQRAESIHVLSFELPELEFKAGLSTEVTSQKSSLLQTSMEEGKIYYELDAADDFDDEGPDHDLDV